MTKDEIRDRLVELLCEVQYLGGLEEKLADYLIAHDVTFAEESKWIPVSERLPKCGEMVLCNTDYFFEALQWDERADIWVGRYRSYLKTYVTHWMPLPDPPKEET